MLQFPPKEQWISHWQSIIVTLGTLGIISTALFLESQLLEQISEFSHLALLRVMLAMAAIIGILAAVVIGRRPKLQFDSRLSIYKDKKSELFYCPSCYAKGSYSPLKHQEDGWRCPVQGCRLFFKNPDYVAPPAGKTVQHKGYGSREWRL